MHRIFVYGTLKTGQPNHYLLNNEKNGVNKFIGIAKTKMRLPLVIASRFNIPFLLPTTTDKAKNVLGELYEVDDKMLAVLDELESHPVFYERLPIDVTMETGGELTCECYLLTHCKPFMLDLECFENYDSYATHKKEYVSRADRDVPAESLWSGIKEMKKIETP